MKRTILCIDLKSFYATCECILLNKDPFTTPLVVANYKQGMGAITLAITPALKKLGIKSRTRLFLIPKDIKYEIIMPKMSHYIEMSKKVISIYLDFVSKDDLHVYSIDESFLDVTHYLKYYNMTDLELGKYIMDTIYKKTKLYATCGIGENMFLAKAAMDNESKKNKDSIAKWELCNIENTLWKLDLIDMWGIGKNMEKRLNELKIYNVYELAHANKDYLINKLGIIGEELWLHANGFDDAIISENDYIVKNTSYANSQILFKDYSKQEIYLIIYETLEILTKRLRKNNKMCKRLSLTIGYSKIINDGFNRHVTLDNYTKNIDELYDNAIMLFNKFYLDSYPIRKVGISLSIIKSQNEFQTNLFNNSNKLKDKEKISNSIDKIDDKYGKNTIVKASALLNNSTIIERGKKIGGHNA